jgi:hypothetical protein
VSQRNYRDAGPFVPQAQNVTASGESLFGSNAMSFLRREDAAAASETGNLSLHSQGCRFNSRLLNVDTGFDLSCDKIPSKQTSTDSSINKHVTPSSDMKQPVPTTLPRVDIFPVQEVAAVTKLATEPQNTPTKPTSTGFLNSFYSFAPAEVFRPPTTGASVDSTSSDRQHCDETRERTI